MSRSSGYHEINNKNAVRLRITICAPRYMALTGNTYLRQIQHFTNGRDRPIDGLPVDHQGWGKTDHVVVGLFCKDTLVLQSFTESTGTFGLGLEFDADQQAAPAYFLDMRAGDLT